MHAPSETRPRLTRIVGGLMEDAPADEAYGRGGAGAWLVVAWMLLFIALCVWAGTL